MAATNEDKDDLAEAVSRVKLGDKVDDLKSLVRSRVQQRMRDLDLLVPFKHHREDGQPKIPYFKGSEAAARRLAGAREFVGAATVKVNPSLAQMAFRKAAMRAGKDTLVPVPALSKEGAGGAEGAWAHLVEGAVGAANWKRACTKAGAARYGAPVVGADLSAMSSRKIDLYVVGCVAVTAEGVRLGKGKGYAELEWAVLHALGAVDPQSTVVATTAHEAQLVSPSELPANSMAPHDLPVDLIATPRRLIRARRPLPKPACGVLWDMVSEADLETMPVLKELKKLQEMNQ